MWESSLSNAFIRRRSSVANFWSTMIHLDLCSPCSMWYEVFIDCVDMSTYKTWECESRLRPFTFLVFWVIWVLNSAVYLVNRTKFSMLLVFLLSNTCCVLNFFIQFIASSLLYILVSLLTVEFSFVWQVFSKLKENRFPSELELKDLVARRITNSRVVDGLGASSWS